MSILFHYEIKIRLNFACQIHFNSSHVLHIHTTWIFISFQSTVNVVYRIVNCYNQIYVMYVIMWLCWQCWISRQDLIENLNVFIIIQWFYRYALHYNFMKKNELNEWKNETLKKSKLWTWTYNHQHTNYYYVKYIQNIFVELTKKKIMKIVEIIRFINV